MTLNYLLRKFQFKTLQQKKNHIMYKDDIKVFTKNENKQENFMQNIRIYSQDTGRKF